MKLFVTAFLILLSYTNSCAQDLKNKQLVHVHKNTYQYGTEVVKFRNLKGIFEEDDKALYYYNSAQLGKVTGVIFGTISIAFLASSINFLVNASGTSPFGGLDVFLVFAGSSIFGTIGLITRSLGLKSMNRAMDRINSLNLKDFGATPEKISINFGFNSGGVGLTINF